MEDIKILTTRFMDYIAESEIGNKIFDPEAQAIYQSGFGLVRDGKGIHKLGILGLGPCIGLVGYHVQSKLLLVA
ncbi:MAG: hypothetical protein AAB457_00740, partial [Patescibacteria group bacterium]